MYMYYMYIRLNNNVYLKYDIYTFLNYTRYDSRIRNACIRTYGVINKIHTLLFLSIGIFTSISLKDRDFLFA